MTEQQGIQSVEAAVRVLKAMAAVNRSMSLKEIAKAAEMPASNTHRYLVSFIRADLVQQESGSGLYDLGPFALHLGLAAMARMDSIEVATKVLHELRAEIDMPVTLSVWTPEGPTMIRWLDASHPLTVNQKPGSRSPMLNSASGRVFLAYEPQEKTKTVVAAELRIRKGRKETTFITHDEVDRLRVEVRKHRLGRSIGERVVGIIGLSAPVFDAMGQLACTISTVGLAHSTSPDYDGPIALAVRAAAERASILLGYRPHLDGEYMPRRGMPTDLVAMPAPVGGDSSRPESVLALRDGRVYASHSRKGVARAWPASGSESNAEGADLVFPHPDFVPNGIALLADGSFLIANLGSRGGLWRLVDRATLVPAVPAGVLPESPLGHVYPDAQGRTWLALTTTSHPRESAFKPGVRDGRIGVIDERGRFKVCAEGLGMANEVRVDPSGRWLYVTETFARRLSRFEIKADATLAPRETVCEFGPATFPDGFAFDVRGHAWVTSVVSNRLIEVTVDGGVVVHFTETDEALLATAEANFQGGRYGPADVRAGAAGVLQNLSSIAFGGAELTTLYFGNLTGSCLTTSTSTAQGHELLHWRYGATVLD